MERPVGGQEEGVAERLSRAADECEPDTCEPSVQTGSGKARRQASEARASERHVRAARESQWWNWRGWSERW